MADWNHPLLTDPYADVLTTYLNGRDVDAITLQKNSVSNLPVGAMAYDRPTDLLKEWSGTAFVNKKLSIAGGGTGADNPTQARTNLGLGSMATQNSNSVNITGGSISGVAFDANSLTTGILALARGGTGATLALGAAGTFLQSNGSQVLFNVDGSQLTNLNGNNVLAGVVPLAHGGTGASLTIGPFGSFIGTDGASVFFHTNGQALVNLNAAALAFGTIPPARLPSGVSKIAQVVYNTFLTPSNLTSSFAPVAGHSIAITPTSATSVIRVNFSFRIFLAGNSGTNTNVSARIKRNGTVVYSITDMSLTSNFPAILAWMQHLDFLDSPATTSALTYQLEAVLPTAGTNFAAIGGFGDTISSTMFATEITV